MPRPRLQRRLRCRCRHDSFKPAGMPARDLEQVILTREELEALRLKDVLGLDQIEAAEQMKTSQSTFQRILASARRKVSEAIVKGKILIIQ